MEDRNSRFNIDPFRGQVIQLWQGTVLERKVDGNISRKLVVSADCDLTVEKGNREFFALEIIPVGDFVEQLVGNDALPELVSIHVRSARETASRRTPSFNNVSDDVMFEWLTESSEDRWEIDLPKVHANERDWLLALRDSINRLSRRKMTNGSIANCDNDTPSILLKCESQQLMIQTGKFNKKIKEIILKQVQPSRVDLYILPSLPGDSSTAGYIVPFKSLALMARNDVCMQRMDLIEKPDSFLPRATCRPVLLQSLLQKMMTYFVRIGLTNNFESEQKDVVKNLVESLR